MRAHRKSLVGVSFAAAALVGAFAVIVSCSDDANLFPTTDAAVVPSEGGGADGSVDGGGQDAGNDGCVSTEPRCNSCATAPADPYNACSSAVTNCVPFDAKRIPQGPGGGIPQVP